MSEGSLEASGLALIVSVTATFQFEPLRNIKDMGYVTHRLMGHMTLVKWFFSYISFCTDVGFTTV